MTEIINKLSDTTKTNNSSKGVPNPAHVALTAKTLLKQAETQNAKTKQIQQQMQSLDVETLASLINNQISIKDCRMSSAEQRGDFMIDDDEDIGEELDSS